MRYFSMFSGIGGFEIPLDKIGAKCIGYSEIDKYAIKVYERNFNGHHNYGNATTIDVPELPDFDLLVGGFPCQAFSVAGKRKGFNDTRGTLFFDIARVLQDKRPRHFVLENVKGLLSHDGGKTFQTILGVLADLGYRVEWQVLNSKNFGVPQNRERIYFVGHLGGECGGQVFPIIGADGKDIIVSGVLDTETWRKRHEQIRRFHSVDGVSPTLPTGTGGGVMTKIAVHKKDGNIEQTEDVSHALDSSYHKGLDNHGQRTGVAMPVLTPDRINKRQNGRRMKEDGEPSFTITAQDRHGLYDGIKVRRLTPLECERLQGFPDNWTAGESDTQRYKMCGNAVTVNVVDAVMKGLAKECIN